VQNIGLLIADEIQLVGSEVGLTYEVTISHTQYLSAQTEIKTCIVACGVLLANARDLGEWMGVPSHAIFQTCHHLCSVALTMLAYCQRSTYTSFR
jgi:pre-mRNA-splicing helicase BRR2